jgi:ABC-type dipeptide/oligopeptide/nickel transport system ATPase component
MYDGKIVEVLESRNIVIEAKHPYTRELIDSVLTYSVE